MENLKIAEFKQTLLTYTESVNLPKEVKRMVIREVYESAEKQALQALAAEIKQREEEEKHGESV